MTRHPRLTQLVAATMVLGMVSQGRGAPGEAFTMAAPMLGADPPEATTLRDGDSSVSTQTGAFQYSYPIEVPPGRQGAQPQLALTYSSQAPIYGGIAAGWSLSIPEIRRDTSKGVLHSITVPDLWEDREFISTMAGSRPLIPVTEPGSYETFRAQNDTSYTRYQRLPLGSPTAWLAYGSDGTTYHFGETSMVTNGVDENRAPLTKTEDAFGNTVKYWWLRDIVSNELRIDKIEYGSNTVADPDLPPTARVQFIWETAMECGQNTIGAASSYRTGKLEEDAVHRLGLIKVTAIDPTETVLHQREFDLYYDDNTGSCSSNQGAWRVLGGIQESAWHPNQPHVNLPAVLFEYGVVDHSTWQTVSPAWTWYPQGPLSSGYRYHPSTKLWPTVNYMFVDLDGDGLVDRLSSGNTADYCTAEWARNTGSGFDPAGSIPLPHLPWVSETPFNGCSLNAQYTHVNNTPGGGSCGQDFEGTYLIYRWLDINGDGLTDLVTAIQADRNGYNPNNGYLPYFAAPDPQLEWPACSDYPSCPAPPEECLTNGTVICDDQSGHACGPDYDAMQECLDQSDWVACGRPMACEYLEEEACESGNPFSIGCEIPRLPHERCGRYPWMIYFNEGDGEISTDPVVTLSQIPLESFSGDSPSGAGGFTSSQHAITDLDGDGLLDLIVVPAVQYHEGDPPPAGQISYWFVWKGAGDGGFYGDTTGSPYLWFVPKGARPSLGASDHLDDSIPRTSDQVLKSTGGLADINSDGLQDYYWWTDWDGEGPAMWVFWNNGNQFLVGDYDDARGALRIGDESLTDLSRSYLNPGDEQWDEDFVEIGVVTNQGRLLDYDDDGRVDLLYSELLSYDDVHDLATWSTPEMHFNTGADFQAGMPLTTAEQDAVAQKHVAENFGNWQWSTTSDFMDINGDGAGDNISAVGPSLQVRRTPPTSYPPRLMKKVHNGRGAHTDIQYAPLSDTNVVISDASTGRASPQTRWVVKSMTTTDDFESSSSTTSYKYYYPQWSPDDRGDWSLRGFDKVRTTTPSGSVVEERYGYNVDWSGRLISTLTFPTGNPADPSFNHPTSIVDTEWQAYTLFDGELETFHPTVTRTFTCANGQIETTCRALPSANNGFVRDETVWTAYASTTGGDPTELLYAPSRQYHQTSNFLSEGDRYVDTTYALKADAGVYRLRPTSAVSSWIHGSGPEVFAKTETIWDTSYRTAVEERVYFDAADYGATVRTYDPATGNVLTITKPKQFGTNEKTTLTYDSRQQYVATTTNEAGHLVSTFYDYGTGALLETRGPNKYTCAQVRCYERAVTDIDGVGRPIATHVSRNGASYYDLFKVTQMIYVDAPVGAVPTSITSKKLVNFDGTAVWSETKSELDGHGRPIRTTEYGGAGNAVTTYDYDVAGKLIAVSMPDPSGGGSPVTYTYTFDSIGRPLTMRRPDGGPSGVNMAYDGLTQTTTEVAPVPAGSPVAITTLVHDDFGRLVEVKERLDSGADATTYYGYDPRDVVESVVDPENVTTVMAHDWAGRRTQITRGQRIWSFIYDKNGNVASETSPFPSGGLSSLYTTSFVYDNLDRITSKLPAQRQWSVTDRDLFGTAQTVYEYDFTGNGLNRTGRLYRVTVGTVGGGAAYGGLMTQLTYDAEGNVTEDRRMFTFGGVTDTRRTITSYWPGGKIRQVDYGDGTSTNATATLGRFSYDNREDLNLVETKRVGQSSYETTASLTRNVPGLVTQRSRPGNPTQTATYQYDALGRITNSTVAVGGSGFSAQQAFTYWGSDDPKTLVHTATGLATRNFNFTYDKRHQLTVVGTTQGSFSSSYGFTNGGRLQSANVAATAFTGSDVKNRNVTYVYAPPQSSDPEMLVELRNTNGTPFWTYQYDEAGNVISQTEIKNPPPSITHTMLWDGEDQLRRVSSTVSGSTREEYFYDHDGARAGIVKRNNSTGAVTQVKYFQGPLEVWYSNVGTLTNRYAHVAGGTPFSRVESLGTGTTQITAELQYHGPLQSLLAAVSTNGTVTSAFAYGPYGEVLQTTGSQTAVHRRRYNDKHQDELTNFLYYGARYFDPVALVWKSADPAYRFTPDAAWAQPRRAALYAFDIGNPMRFVDPDGREGEEAQDIEEPPVESVDGPIEFVAAGIAGFLSRGAGILLAGAFFGEDEGTALFAVAAGYLGTGRGAGTSRTAKQSTGATDEAGGGIADRPYNRKADYGRTPTAADRKALGAGPDDVVDHNPPLSQRFHEGDPAVGEPPGYQQTPAQRRASAKDRSRMRLQKKADSHAQGGKQSAYSKRKNLQLKRFKSGTGTSPNTSRSSPRRPMVPGASRGGDDHRD